MAYCWGVKVGRDELDIDTAYVYARTRAEALEEGHDAWGVQVGRMHIPNGTVRSRSVSACRNGADMP